VFRNLYGHLCRSKLAQAGVACVLLGVGVQALDELGQVDLAAVPYIGKYAGAILATAGVSKIILRAAIAILTAFGSVSGDSVAPKS
jgi:hypothetical protein